MCMPQATSLVKLWLCIGLQAASYCCLVLWCEQALHAARPAEVLCRVASGTDSATVLVPIAAVAAEAVVPHLAAASPAPLRAAAAQLLLALARLDADAVWLLLFRLSAQVITNSLCSDVQLF